MDTLRLKLKDMSADQLREIIRKDRIKIRRLKKRLRLVAENPDAIRRYFPSPAITRGV